MKNMTRKTAETALRVSVCYKCGGKDGYFIDGGVHYVVCHRDRLMWPAAFRGLDHLIAQIERLPQIEFENISSYTLVYGAAASKKGRP